MEILSIGISQCGERFKKQANRELRKTVFIHWIESSAKRPLGANQRTARMFHRMHTENSVRSGQHC